MLEQKVNKGTMVPRISIWEDSRRVAFVIDLVALTTGISAPDIAAATRGHARASRARQVAMYLAYVSYEWSLVRVGQAFGRDRTTIAHACRLIEDMRDDRQFDDMLDRLEICLRAAPAPMEVRLLSPNLIEMAA